MIKVIHTMALNGINGIPVVVESSCVGSPSPRLDIIGLPDAAVKEAAGRVRAAARSSGLPLHNGVLTVNLAPADVRKEGSSFDLPILLSLVNTDAFMAREWASVVEPKSIVLAAILLILTNKVKKTKNLHPVFYIAASAVVGIVFHFAGI